MVTRVTRQRWRQLLSIMETKLPDSFEIYGLLKTSLSGDWPFYNIWVDQWPLVSAVVASPKYKLLDEFSGKFTVLYGQEGDVVTEMLQHPGIVHWPRDLTFDLPPHLMPALMEAAHTYRGQLSIISKCDTHISTKNTKPKLIPLKYGTMVLEKLTLQDAGFVAEKWGVKDQGVERFIERLISTNLLNVCVRTSIDRKIIAFSLTQPTNVIGMNYVDPAFRGHKLGSLVNSHMIRRTLLTSSFAAGLVETGNIAAQKASMTVGGQISNVKVMTVGFRSTRDVLKPISLMKFKGQY